MATTNGCGVVASGDGVGDPSTFFFFDVFGVGCGVCQLGCPIGGKGSVDKNLLPAAIENGANVYSELRVRDVRVERGVARGVTAEILDADDVATGLRDFRPSADLSPGRLNLYRLGAWTVIVDFAHNEAGLSAVLDGAVTIPMAGRTESLNVGMAASVLCFEAARQRRSS